MCAEKSWVDIFQALLTPTIAIAGVLIGYYQWRNNEYKRQNELFDKRFEFYKKSCDAWLATGNPDAQSPDVEDLIPISEEAKFLFGDDIALHILSLEGKSHNGSPFFPNIDFSEPFYKYLRLK